MLTKKKRSFLVIAVVFIMAAVGGYVCQISLRNNNINSNSSITKIESENDNEKDNVDVSLQYAGEDVVLAESDIIRPGYKIDSVKSFLEREIPKGDYKGKYIVHFYNEQDEEEIINSEIAINIYVR